MTELGPIIVAGIVAENVTRSETAAGQPVASWWLQAAHQWAGPVDFAGKSVWCRATGHAANSACKYLFHGARIMLAGVVREWDVPPEGGGQSELFIAVEMIAYQSPREIAQAAAKRGRTL